MKVVIMAGGKGSRIAELYPNIPKPLIPIKDIPVLERELIDLREQGFTEVVITVSHMADKIIDYFKNGEKLGITVDYFVEETPLGNAGALFEIKDSLTENFLLLNADAVFNVDFKRLIEFHKKHKALATLLTHPNNHPYDSGLVLANKYGQVENWLTKEDDRPMYYKNRVNSGIHVISKKLLEVRPESFKVDLDRQVLKPLAGTGKMWCYDSPEYIRDMGTPERYRKVCEDFEKGIIEDKNLKHKQKAIFLDRDGTINKYKGFIRDITDFELIEGVSKAIKLINESGYLAIVITNQPVIARGEVSYEQLEDIHNKMETLLGNDGAYLDRIYFCPHHPDKGYAGEVEELKINCNCRKPKPGLFLKAKDDYNIDLEKSWMIGDSEIDIIAGKSVGAKTALISSGTESFGEDLKEKSLLDVINKLFT